MTEAMSDLFESTDDQIKRVLGGLVKKYHWKVDSDGYSINLWVKSDAFNITKIAINAFKEIGYELAFVTLSNEKTVLLGGEVAFKPMVIFQRVRE